MKRFSSTLFIIWLMANHSAQAQFINLASNSIPIKRYVINLRLIDQKGTQSGILFDLTDSTVVLSKIKGQKQAINTLIQQNKGTLPPTDSLRAELDLRTYRYDKIRRLRVRREESARLGFLIGAGIGVVAGAIHGDTEAGFIRIPASVFMFGFGFYLSAFGAIVGTHISKNVNARKQSVATEVPTRFRKLTIVEQVKQAKG